MNRTAISLFAWLACAGTTLAAPLKLDWVYPAGAGRGSTTTLTVSDGSTWPVNVWIDNPQGVTIEAHKDKGKLTLTVAADAAPGIRWIRLHDKDTASPARPLIIGTLPEITEHDKSEPQEITEPLVVNGRLSKKGEVDVYRVKLRKGSTLVASMTANETFAAPMDGVIQVCDADGFVLTQNDDTHGIDPRAVYEVPRDGDYLLRVFAFPAVPDGGINFAGGVDFIYRLTVTTAGFADHTLPLAVRRGQSNQVKVHGWNIPSDAETLAVPAEGEGDIAWLFHPALGNALPLPIVDFPSITASEDTTLAKPQSVEVPCVITGRLRSHLAPRDGPTPSPSPGDQGEGRGEGRDEQTSSRPLPSPSLHAFTFPAKKGAEIRLRVDSYALGYALDPVLRITDTAGKQLAENDDMRREGDSARKPRDAALEFKPPADGTYTVTVRDLHRRGGFRFVYRLWLEPATPDFALTLEKDAYTVAAGQAVEVPVTIARRDGYSGEISIRIEGDAEFRGAAAPPPVVSKMKDASEKSVKLKITAPIEPSSGSFRIIAESAGTRRIAAFAATGGARLTQAWLTVTKGK